MPLVMLVFALAGFLLPAAGIADSRPPNIVFIVIDDTGLADRSVNDNTMAEATNPELLDASMLLLPGSCADFCICAPYR